MHLSNVWFSWLYCTVTLCLLCALFLIFREKPVEMVSYCPHIQLDRHGKVCHIPTYLDAYVTLAVGSAGSRRCTYSIIVTVFPKNPCHEQRLSCIYMYELVKCCLLCLTASLVGPWTTSFVYLWASQVLPFVFDSKLSRTNAASLIELPTTYQVTWSSGTGLSRSL